MKPRLRTLASVVVLAGLATAPGLDGSIALAQSAPLDVPSDVSDSGATTLAMMLTDRLTAWFAPASPDADVAVVWDGSVTVTPAGSHYDVRIPALTFVDQDGESLVVDGTSLTVTPVDGTRLDVALTLPAIMPLLDSTGVSKGALSLGTQRFVGTWLPALDALLALDASYDTVTLEITGGAPDERGRLSAADATMTVALDETAQGRWSGPSTLSLGQLEATDVSGRRLLDLDRLDFTWDIDAMDLSAWAQWLETLGQTTTHRTAGTSLFNGVALSADVAGFSIIDPEDSSQLAVAAAGVEIGLQGLDGEQSTVNIAYHHDGLTLEPGLERDAFTPTVVTIDITADGLPNSGLANAANNFLNTVTTAGSAAGLMFAQQVLVNLSVADSELRFDRISFETPEMATSLNGIARFDVRSPYGVTARFDVMTRGMDAALSALQPRPGESLDDTTQTALAVLGMLQAMGLPDTDDQGRPVRTYAVEVSANGRAMLNGADLTALIGGIRQQTR